MATFAFAFPTAFGNVPGQGVLNICFLCAAGDGTNPPSLFEITFTWDPTQAVATNIANLKTAIVNLAASQVGIAVLSSNVGVFAAVS